RLGFTVDEDPGGVAVDEEPRIPGVGTPAKDDAGGIPEKGTGTVVAFRLHERLRFQIAQGNDGIAAVVVEVAAERDGRGRGCAVRALVSRDRNTAGTKEIRDPALLPV